VNAQREKKGKKKQQFAEFREAHWLLHYSLSFRSIVGQLGIVVKKKDWKTDNVCLFLSPSSPFSESEKYTSTPW